MIEDIALATMSSHKVDGDKHWPRDINEHLLEDEKKKANILENVDGSQATDDVSSYKNITVYDDCVQYESSATTDDNNDCNCLRCNLPKDLHKTSNSSKKLIRGFKRTDAVGEMEFRFNGNTAKYIKVGDKVPVKTLFNFIEKSWFGSTSPDNDDDFLPKLFVSVTGGAQDFKTSEKLQESLKEGLKKICGSTKVWIMTGGTDTGVMKLVGDVWDGESLSNLALFGVATWGVVLERESLLEKQARKHGMASYSHDTNEQKDLSELEQSEDPNIKVKDEKCSHDVKSFPLNPNHTHFVLVDSGKYGKYGGEIAYRANIERYIMQLQIEKEIKNLQQSISIKKKEINYSTNVSKNPSRNQLARAVQIVIEGGPNTIKQVKEGLYNETDLNAPIMPVIIIEGSGRAADLLAYAYPFKFQEFLYPLTQSGSTARKLTLVSDDVKLRNKIEVLFNNESTEKQLEIFQNVLLIMRKKHYITIYSPEKTVDLDETILTSLLKVNNIERDNHDDSIKNEILQFSKISLLNLALSLNRVDIAKNIFKDLKHSCQLENVMSQALLENKHEFVELMLDNQFQIYNFLNVKKLEELYIIDKRDNNTIAGYGYTTLTAVQQHLKKLIGIDIAKHYVGKDNSDNFQYPYTELFLWSVLCFKHELALLFLRRGEETILKGLIGRLIYQKISYKLQDKHQELGSNERLYKQLDEYAEHFGKHAVLVLNEYTKINNKDATNFLQWVFKRWGNHTCMSLAVCSELEEFIENECCQDIISALWSRGIAFNGKVNNLRIILGIFCFPILYCCTRFDAVVSSAVNEEKHKVSHTTSTHSEKRYTLRKVQEENDSLHLVAHQFKDDTDGTSKTTSCWPKPLYHAYLFYTAPVTRFWTYFISYVVFLTLFSYIVTRQLERNLSTAEIAVSIYVLSLACEEVRQICQAENCIGFWEKVKSWWKNRWNRYDLVAVLFFLTGFILRMMESVQLRNIGHVIYTFDNMLWMLRLLDSLSVSAILGPYVVMVQRMMNHLVYFGVIVSVFWMSYGVTKFAILQPDIEGPTYWAMHMFGIPYFEIYGELFLEVSPEANKTMFQTNEQGHYREALAVFLLAMYLVVTNILLINLLIAIFNNTYDEVRKNSNRIWKNQRYYLVTEFANRPSLPPPFIVIEHFIIFIQWAFGNCTSMKINENGVEQRELEGRYNHQMKVEKECIKTIIKRENNLQNVSLENNLYTLNKRMEIMSQVLENTLKENIALNGKLLASNFSNEARLQRIEHHVKNKKDLNAVPSSPIKQTIGQTENPQLWKLLRGQSVLRDEKDEVDSATQEQSKKSNSGPVCERYPKSLTLSRVPTLEKIHVLARCSKYPLSTIERFLLPDAFVPWQVSHPGYKPRDFTADIIKADLPSNDKTFDRNNPPKFNALDGDCDRRSFEAGGYTVDEVTGLPRNPYGRTGLSGRGLLRRYGPNHIAEAIFVRPAFAEQDGQKQLQVLVMQKGYGEYVLPADELKPNQKLPVIFEELFNSTTLKKLGMMEMKRAALMAAFKATLLQRKKVYTGYLDDERNTDNAWIETSVYYYMLDENSPTLSKFLIYNEQANEEEKLHLKWINLDENTPLVNRHHMFYLQVVAEMENAYFIVG